MPMARDLRRRLEFSLGDRDDLGVPAADRTVRLDHNSSAYRDATNALDNLERALSDVNDYPDPEDKEQRIAEISATRRLLGSVRVRIGALVAIAVPVLTHLATRFLDTGIGKLAGVAIEKLTALVGAIF